MRLVHSLGIVYYIQKDKKWVCMQGAQMLTIHVKTNTELQAIVFMSDSWWQTTVRGDLMIMALMENEGKLTINHDWEFQWLTKLILNAEIRNLRKYE